MRVGGWSFAFPGRRGNGVGLDTPAATVNVLGALKRKGYAVTGIPEDGAALIERLMAGPTNDFKELAKRNVTETLSMADYKLFLAALPESVRKAVHDRWGAAEKDPFFIPGGADGGSFASYAFRLGNVAVCLQPARGCSIDPSDG